MPTAPTSMRLHECTDQSIMKLREKIRSKAGLEAYELLCSHVDNVSKDISEERKFNEFSTSQQKLQGSMTDQEWREYRRIPARLLPCDPIQI